MLKIYFWAWRLQMIHEIAMQLLKLNWKRLYVYTFFSI